MRTDRNKVVPAVYLVLQKDAQVLLLRRQGSGYYDGWHSLPAGHVDAGELPLDSIIRETKEEIGVAINKKDIRLVHTLYRTKRDETGDRADYFFAVDQWAGQPSICEPEKCDDLSWFPMANLPKNVIPYVRDVLHHVTNKILYSELGAAD